MTWREECAEIIRQATEDLPARASLDERKSRISAARPYWVANTSWGRKSWQAARRDYLIPFGYQPKTKKAKTASEAGLPLFEEAKS